MYWIMVVSLDQCFCECVISHSGGNSNRRWHRAVFPGRSPGQAGKSPTSDPQNTAVISRLSRARPTSTLFTPCWSMVQLLLRTILMPVRSQFRINSRGDFFHFHSGYHIFQNSLFTQSKSVMAYLLFAVVAFLWTKFIRCSNVYAQCQF